MSVRGNKCHFCAISGPAHRKQFGSDLELHHVLPARFVEQIGGNPHDPENLIWLCEREHGQARAAEEALKGKAGMYGFVQEYRTRNWDLPLLKRTFAHYNLPINRLPWE